MERQRKVMEELQRGAQIRRENAAKRKKLIERLNREHPICQTCSDTPPYTGCPGFEPHEFKPLECKHCTHNRINHTFLRKLDNSKLTLKMVEANAKVFDGFYNDNTESSSDDSGSDTSSSSEEDDDNENVPGVVQT